MLPLCLVCSVFFFNDPTTTEIYTLSLHDALPISKGSTGGKFRRTISTVNAPSSSCLVKVIRLSGSRANTPLPRSEEHTSELQSPMYLVCRLLLEKKKKKTNESQEDDKYMQYIHQT